MMRMLVAVAAVAVLAGTIGTAVYAEGMALEECFEGGPPAGFECVTLESFPVQVKCYPVACETVDGPVTILPAPAPEDGPASSGASGEEPAEPGIAPGEPAPCVPVEECIDTDDGSMVCAPGDDPCGPQPDANVRCLPPDCAVSSDGTVSCPAPLPMPCAAPGSDGGPAIDVPVCETPPGCGVDAADGLTIACDPVCIDNPALTPEECARIDPPVDSGGGESSPGAPPAIE
jgi:hypothetical protein